MRTVINNNEGEFPRETDVNSNNVPTSEMGVTVSAKKNGVKYVTNNSIGKIYHFIPAMKKNFFLRLKHKLLGFFC